EPATPSPEPPSPRSRAPVAGVAADAEAPPSASRTPVQQARAQRLTPGYRSSPTVAGGRPPPLAAVQRAPVGERRDASEPARAPERSRASGVAGNPPPVAGGGRGPGSTPERRPTAGGYQLMRGAATSPPVAPPARAPVRRGPPTTRGTSLGPVAAAPALPIQRQPAAGRAGYRISAGPSLAPGAGRRAPTPLAPLLAVLPVQAKVEIGATNDPLEHEADRVADTVVSSPPTATGASAHQSHATSIAAPADRADGGGPAATCACGSCLACASKAGAGGGASIQRKPAPGASGAEVGGAAAAHGGVEMGEPLAADVRERVEPVLGADLGGVRVHSGAGASAAAGSIGARAFTHGNDIWLGAGE